MTATYECVRPLTRLTHCPASNEAHHCNWCSIKTWVLLFWQQMRIVSRYCSHYWSYINLLGRAMAQAVSRRPLTEEARVRSYVRPCEIFGRRSGTGTGFSPSTPVSPVSIIPPMLHTHSFIYHRRCKYFSPSTPISPVSIIPPTLHTHSFAYHRRCIMFFSQYFSFPCQYHSTNAPYISFTHRRRRTVYILLATLNRPQKKGAEVGSPWNYFVTRVPSMRIKVWPRARRV
jgi:hypothetical protein